MNPLPFDNQHWAFARIITAPSFNVTAWTVQPMWSKRRNGFGFELISCTRAALPAVGEAVFQYHYGLIDGTTVGVETPESSTRRLAGSDWDDTVNTATGPDLSGHEVRIQLAPAVATGATPAWQTVWWGQVEYQEDGIWPGAGYPAGTRTYRCVDGFARAKRWPLNRHSVYYSPDYFIDVEGHPGYNVGKGGRVIGNKSSDANAILSSASAAERGNSSALNELVALGDTGYLFHDHQGIAGIGTFTTQEALEDAVRKTRGFGEPIFNFYGQTDLLGDSIAIPVNEGDTAWDIVSRICRRERGRGMVFVDWANDSAAPTGALTVRLTVRPQTLDDITYAVPSTVGTGTLTGATTATTTTTVDVIGDHRLVISDTRLGDKFMHVADAVETIGELIQILVTLSYYDNYLTLARRWTTGERVTTFAALDPAQRADDAWGPMWQLHGLPLAWDGRAGDHNGGDVYSCDFMCNDDGYFRNSRQMGKHITSPILVRIMPDMPLYEGYNHAASPPKRKIGDQGALDENGQPGRRPPLVFIRTAADRYYRGDGLPGGKALTIRPQGRDLLIFEHGKDGQKYRLVGDITSSIGSKYNLSQLGVTVGLELPHRVRCKSYRTGQTAQTVKRLVTVRLPGLHLWLAHSGAIWDVDGTTKNSDGYSPLRTAAGGVKESPGVLRDDRDALARLHAMACAWYLSPRQTAHWTLRACGMLPSFETLGDDPGSATEVVTYPTMGQLVTDFKANGQIYTLNTPITSIHYDHQSGKTTWETDWQELDFT